MLSCFQVLILVIHILLFWYNFYEFDQIKSFWELKKRSQKKIKQEF